MTAIVERSLKRAIEGTKLCLTVFCLSLAIGTKLSAADQGHYYVTEDDRTFLDETGRRSRSPESITEAQQAKDSRPAEHHPF
jgi:hypothetical protein